MLQPEEQLRNISFDQEVYDVLCTPNRIKYGANEFQGWSNTRQHPYDSPERKPHLNPIKKPTKINSFRLYTSQHQTARTLNIQNKQNFSISPYELQKTMKIMQLIDQQVLSPKSRKIINPKQRVSQQSSRKFCTPKTSHRTREISLIKIANTERLRKDDGIDQLRQKFHKKYNQNNENLKDNQIDQFTNRGQLKQDNFKIPLSAILYPVLKLNSKRPARRMQRFQSFVARSVKKVN